MSADEKLAALTRVELVVLLRWAISRAPGSENAYYRLHPDVLGAALDRLTALGLLGRSSRAPFRPLTEEAVALLPAAEELWEARHALG